MKSYSVAQFKARFSQILEDVSKGREVIVTDHNRPVAKLVALTAVPELPDTDVKEVLSIVPVKLKAGAQSTLELLREIRDED